VGLQGTERELTMQAAQPHTPNLPSFSSSKNEARIALRISSWLSTSATSYPGRPIRLRRPAAGVDRTANILPLALSSQDQNRTPRRLTQ